MGRCAELSLVTWKRPGLSPEPAQESTLRCLWASAREGTFPLCPLSFLSILMVLLGSSGLWGIMGDTGWKRQQQQCEGRRSGWKTETFRGKGSLGSAECAKDSPADLQKRIILSVRSTDTLHAKHFTFMNTLKPPNHPLMYYYHPILQMEKMRRGEVK